MQKDYIFFSDNVIFGAIACELSVSGKVKIYVAVAKASLNKANKSEWIDTKPSDLPLNRLKLCKKQRRIEPVDVAIS